MTTAEQITQLQMAVLAELHRSGAISEESARTADSIARRMTPFPPRLGSTLAALERRGLVRSAFSGTFSQTWWWLA